MYLTLAIAAALCLTGFMVWASADVGSGVYLKALCRSRTSGKTVALTFDDGPDTMTGKVLDVLGKHGVKATFFFVGSKAEGHRDVVRRIVEEGHTVGNHTWSHGWDFPLMPRCRVETELERTSEEIYRMTGKRPALFRPPFGVTNPIIGRAVRARSLVTVGWNVRSLDTVDGTPREKVLRRIVRKLRPGSVILLHDRCGDSDRLLEMLLDHLDENGFKVVTLEEMFGIDAYAE